MERPTTEGPQASLQRPVGPDVATEALVELPDPLRQCKRARPLPMGNKVCAMACVMGDPLFPRTPKYPGPRRKPPPAETARAIPFRPPMRPIAEKPPRWVISSAIRKALCKARLAPPPPEPPRFPRNPAAERARGIPPRPPTRPIAEKPPPWAIRKARLATVAKKAMSRPPPGYEGAAGQRR